MVTFQYFVCLLQAVEQFGNQRQKEDELKEAKEKELQLVQVKKEDIELIVSLIHFSVGCMKFNCFALFLDE